MIVVRNVFRLKFGKAKEAVALLKEGIAIQKRAGVEMSQRLMRPAIEIPGQHNAERRPQEAIVPSDDRHVRRR